MAICSPKPRAKRFAADSPLEEAGFELLVPQSIQLGGLTPDVMAGRIRHVLFSRTSH
jgi:hypothetical protein